MTSRRWWQVDAVFTPRGRTAQVAVDFLTATPTSGRLHVTFPQRGVGLDVN